MRKVLLIAILAVVAIKIVPVGRRVELARAQMASPGASQWALTDGQGQLWFEGDLASVCPFDTVQRSRRSDIGPRDHSCSLNTSADSRLLVGEGQEDVRQFAGDIVFASGMRLVSSSGLVDVARPRLAFREDLSEKGWMLFDAAGDPAEGLVLHDVMLMFDRVGGQLTLGSDDIRLTPDWAQRLGDADWVKRRAGSILLRATMHRLDNPGESPGPDREPGTVGGLASVIGPDVVVHDIRGAGISYGTEGGASAFSIGTVSCNLGDQPAVWYGSNNQHPVIAQQFYRLKGNRFEQIGMAWVKHGFFATLESECGGCINPHPPGSGNPGTLLGVGCSDPYSAALNGEQAALGPRSQINAHTGVFPYGFSAPACGNGDSLCRRLRVNNSDIDPSENPGALYIAEALYVTPDDAAAGNANNNASHRQIQFSGPNAMGRYTASFSLDPDKLTQRYRPAIRAWKDQDPTVVETDIQLPAEGLFILAAKATDLGTGYWHFEYALQNLNSDRSGGSFTVPLPPGAIVTDVGFHDVDYHSGEPFDGTDWVVSKITDEITWATEAHASNPNANALRWGTLYNFRFSTNVEPGPTTIILGLFKPGPFPDVTAATIGPKLALIDCNDNEIADACDISCAAVDCVPPCGTSTDCNNNGVPDECERDCNNNGVPDTCDVDPTDPDGDGHVSEDCNGNLVPDECEPDCDGDGIPDDCDTFDDRDGDGVPDCFDLCPDTNPLGACVCPPQGDCCFPSLGGICLSEFGLPPISPQACLESDGIPECQATLVCRDGCLLGDWDDDGDLDLFDFQALQSCFSGSVTSGGFEVPSTECRRVFDYNSDSDVDRLDFGVFQSVYTGP